MPLQAKDLFKGSDVQDKPKTFIKEVTYTMHYKQTYFHQY